MKVDATPESAKPADAASPAIALGSPEFQKQISQKVTYDATRRIFLRNSALAMVGVGRRARSGCSARSMPPTRPAPRKKILVAIFQRGAADGLNVVVPHGEKRYYELRPTIAIPRPERRPRRRLRPSIWTASSACIRRSRR